MMTIFTKKIFQSLRVICFEIYCLLCCLIGCIKVKLFFSKGRNNRLEIGAGISKKDGMLTSDLSLKSDYPFDFRVGLPFPDDSIDFIYAEHVLEHFQYKEMLLLLRECKRVMKPCAELKVSVPNARIYLDAYVSLDKFDQKSFCTLDTGLNFDSRINYVNYIFYMDGHHRYMFDEKNILSVLGFVGFSQVCLRRFDPAIDQQARKHESIYAQGIK